MGIRRKEEKKEEEKDKHGKGRGEEKGGKISEPTV